MSCPLGSGLLFVMVHSSVEAAVLEKCFKEVDLKIKSDKSWTEEEIEKLQQKPWDVLVCKQQSIWKTQITDLW